MRRWWRSRRRALLAEVRCRNRRPAPGDGRRYVHDVPDWFGRYRCPRCGTVVRVVWVSISRY